MNKIYILALHLAYGGIEKAIVNTANLLSERYEVEIISVYNMPDSPAFPLSDRVKVRYLLKDIPNKEQWKKSLRDKRPLLFIRESLRAVKILAAKKLVLIRAVRGIKHGVVISTRHEDNMLLSRYGRPDVGKIAQLHHDHKFDEKLLEGFKKGYGNIDVFMLLTPGLVGELAGVMVDNRHTRLVAVPNFLEKFPENAEAGNREKLILSAGRLEPVKGFDRLIEAFAAVRENEPEWKLVILGEGADRGKLQQLIEQKGIEDCVSLPGKADFSEVEQYMSKASVFAMSSHSEGLPFVLVEALSCKLPVVAYDVRVGPAAVIGGSGAGILVEDGKTEEYAAALLRLIQDEKIRLEMAEAAALRADYFSRENVSRLWYELLEEFDEA